MRTHLFTDISARYISANTPSIEGFSSLVTRDDRRRLIHMSQAPRSFVRISTGAGAWL